MRFSTFQGLRDNVPQMYEGWDAFAKQFKLRETDDKEAVPLYCPAEYAEARRLQQNVLHISFGVIDVDSATEEQVFDALNDLTDMNLQVILHSTHSHIAGLAQGKFKCRFIIAFSRPVEVEEWGQVWHGMNTLVGGIADPACMHLNAIYFFPSTPVGTKDRAFVEYINPDGEPLDIDDLLDETDVPERTYTAIQPIDPEKLAAIEADTKFQLAQSFIDIKFEPLTGQGKRNSTAYKVACVCGDFGLEEGSAWPLVQAWNSRNSEPLDDDELMATVESAYAKADDGSYVRRTLSFGWRLFDQAHGDAVDLKDLKREAEKMAHKEGRQGRLGRSLRRVFAGEPIGTDAVRVFEGVAEFLGTRYPYADPNALALLIETSIKKTHAAGHKDVDLELVSRRAAQAQQTHRDKMNIEQRRKQMRELLKIENAFLSVGIHGRNAPYSEKELDRYAEEHHYRDRVELDSQWIVRHNKHFYFFVGGRYTRAYAEGEAGNMAREALAPAKHVKLWRDGANGPAPMKMHELVEAYGTVANEIQIDMCAQVNLFDRHSRILIEAPRHPLRLDIEPVYHECVEELMRSWTEDEALQEKILDWFACVPVLHEPVAALVLHGQPQTGKSFIAHAAARMWLKPGQNQDATDLDDIAGNWTSLLVEDGCPMLLADEHVPKDHMGNPRFDFLRNLIVRRTQSLRRKGIPDATLKGAVRIIVALNNFEREMIPPIRNLNEADIRALTERFLTVKIHNDNDYPREVLDRIRRDPDLNEPFFRGDMIPEMIWWLHQNREVQRGPRLLVEGQLTSQFELKLSTQAGLRSEICRWFAKWVMQSDEARKAGPSTAKPILDTGRDGVKRVLVTASTIHKAWNAHCADVPKPAIGTLSDALGGLFPQRVCLGRKDWFRVVDWRRVKYWALSTGECNSPERFDENLKRAGLPCPAVPFDDDET